MSATKDLENFCRGCLIKYEEPNELIQYTEKTRRQFVYATGLQVKRNDTFTFQVCKECYVNIKMTCKFKKQCRTSDKRYKNYLALKEAGETADFCSFLKKSDDTYRFPFMNGYSTPMHQKYKDDDNESTTTSIRNFMTDMLKAEEIPDVEANIIREAIEEEADILDDSLDSQWLQDDMSIDTDFHLDFSPFATPRSIANNHSYSTKKDDTRHVYAPLSFSPFTTPRSVAKEPCSPKRQEQHHVYVTSKKIVQIEDKNQKNVANDLAPDTIDKNLEKALRGNREEFALDDLLISPAAVTPQVGTPTINDILFGGKTLSCDGDSQSSAQPKVGQCIETFENVRGADDLEELFKNAKMNFYGSLNDNVERNETRDVIDSNVDCDASIDRIEDEEMEMQSANNNTPCKIIPFEFTNIEIVEGTPRKEVFLPAIDENIPRNNDKFQPSVELIYEKSDDQSKENEVPTQNQPSTENKKPKARFYCDICKLDTENYKKTLAHYRTCHKVSVKTKPKPVVEVCDECGKTYTHRGNYLYHIKKAHQMSRDQGTYICDICKLPFTAKSKIITHMRSHMIKQIGTKKQPVESTAKKKLICNICGIQMADHSNLKVHMRRHAKEYTVFCKQCNKGFVRSQDLSIHMRIHTAEKPFACAQCYKTFTRRDSLTTHIRSRHTGEKPFECEFCHAKFARGNFLSQHVRKSETCKKIRTSGVTDFRNAFECEYCHATFRYPCNLSVHVQTSKKCMRVRMGIEEKPKKKYKKRKKRASN